MTEEEFISRFIEHMVANAGFQEFDDCTPVRYYAEEIAPSYWEDFEEGMTPEDCAEADMADWDER